MSIQLVKDWTVKDGAYSNIITMDTPLTITQDGGVDDINSITPTQFHVFNDGKRRDPLFDPNYLQSSGGTPMALRYENIILTPRSFSTQVTTGEGGSNGTSNKIYLGITSTVTPAVMRIEIGTLLKLTNSSQQTEDVLVMGLGNDAQYGSYVNVIRNYKSSSPTGILNVVPGNRVDVSTKHIYLSKAYDFTGIKGGDPLTLNSITNSISSPVPNPDITAFQTIYIKAVPQLQKDGGQQITRIPTQHKTDVYFEISYREYPN